MDRTSALLLGIGVGGLVLAFSAKAVAAVVPGKVKPGKASTYLPLITRAVNRHPEFQGRVRILVGLLAQESRFDPNARSATGAVGLGQFTTIGRKQVQQNMAAKWGTRYADAPAVAATLKTLSRDDCLVPEVAIEAAANLLAYLLSKWSGHVEAALTDYNAGGAAAKIVYNAGSHSAALAQLQALPSNKRSQSPEYAPKVLALAAQFDAGALA